MHGGRLAARALAAQGVTHLFTLCGDHITAILDGCVDEGIRVVDTRTEAAAVHMAEGWSLATGEPGVACVTSGPGFTNAITPLADAALAGVPLVLVAGAIRQSERGRGYPQDLDQEAVARPLAAWSRTARSGEGLPQDVRDAFLHAVRERGPAVLEVPLDVQLARAPEGQVWTDEPTAAPSEFDVGEAAGVLGGAERPVAIVGEGAFWSGGAGALKTFAEASGIPVFTVRAARGLLPDDHELCFRQPNFLRGAGRRMFERADAVLVVGCELDIVLAFGGFAPAAKVVRVERDENRVVRARTPDVAVVADEAPALEALAVVLRRSGGRDAWIEELRAAQKEAEREVPVSEKGVHGSRLAREIAAAVPGPATYTVDAGELALWALEDLPATGPGRLLSTFTTPLATLGAGLPFALAAKLARPDEPAVAVLGDGALGFQAMELDTAARHGIDVVVVIGNDAAWGIVKRQAEHGFGRSVAADLVPRRHDLLAEALGVSGRRVETVAYLRPALHRALEGRGPQLVDVLLDPDPQHDAMAFIAQMFAPEP